MCWIAIFLLTPVLKSVHRFSDLYSKAFGNCQKADSDDNRAVECKAEGSQHISYQFSGEWSGPEGLMPSDDTLKNWKVSKIIWRR